MSPAPVPASDPAPLCAPTPGGRGAPAVRPAGRRGGVGGGRAGRGRPPRVELVCAVGAVGRREGGAAAGGPGAGPGLQLRGRAGCGLAGSAPRPPPPPPGSSPRPPPGPVQLRRGAGSRPVQLRWRLPGAEGGGRGEGAWEPPQLQWRPGRPRSGDRCSCSDARGRGCGGAPLLPPPPPGGCSCREARGLAGRPGRRGSGSHHPPPPPPPPPRPASSYDFSFVAALTRVCFLGCCGRCFPAAPARRPPPPSLWLNLPLSPSVLIAQPTTGRFAWLPTPPRPPTSLKNKTRPPPAPRPRGSWTRGVDLWTGSRRPAPGGARGSLNCQPAPTPLGKRADECPVRRNGARACGGAGKACRRAERLLK